MPLLRRFVALVGLLALLGGCAGGDTETTGAEEATPTELSTAAAATPEPTSSQAAEVEPVESLAGAPLPDALLGEYTVDSGDRFVFYSVGDAFCVDTVGTEQDCYAVYLPGDDAAVEQGVAAADGGVLRMMPTVDPKAGCVGSVNELRWKATADGVTLEPVEDCHGPQSLRLSPAG